jgi:hypothetical protein
VPRKTYLTLSPFEFSVFFGVTAKLLTMALKDLFYIQWLNVGTLPMEALCVTCDLNGCSNTGTSHLPLDFKSIGHEGFVGLSVCKVYISATRWRLFTLTAVALRFCRATEKTPSGGGNKRRATAKSLNDLP